ncbi:hypothetical protein VHEMI04114 [[Torrubiella] hemipterigena]|uniref:Uncharacterized protein n=1 Tax=[Torrubiella] hemipterigena TaxID=1531966 RepID=A0A0A1TCZ6_9HYPO|nr:hypothetical protein VHEMI04114 [[Torrubiella] hemipterigena]
MGPTTPTQGPRGHRSDSRASSNYSSPFDLDEMLETVNLRRESSQLSSETAINRSTSAYKPQARESRDVFSSLFHFKNQSKRRVTANPPYSTDIHDKRHEYNEKESLKSSIFSRRKFKDVPVTPPPKSEARKALSTFDKTQISKPTELLEDLRGRRDIRSRPYGGESVYPQPLHISKPLPTPPDQAVPSLGGYSIAYESLPEPTIDQLPVIVNRSVVSVHHSTPSGRHSSTVPSVDYTSDYSSTPTETGQSRSQTPTPSPESSLVSPPPISPGREWSLSDGVSVTSRNASPGATEPERGHLEELAKPALKRVGSFRSLSAIKHRPSTMESELPPMPILKRTNSSKSLYVVRRPSTTETLAPPMPHWKRGGSTTPRNKLRRRSTMESHIQPVSTFETGSSVKSLLKFRRRSSAMMDTSSPNESASQKPLSSLRRLSMTMSELPLLFKSEKEIRPESGMSYRQNLTTDNNMSRYASLKRVSSIKSLSAVKHRSSTKSADSPPQTLRRSSSSKSLSSLKHRSTDFLSLPPLPSLDLDIFKTAKPAKRASTATADLQQSLSMDKSLPTWRPPSRRSSLAVDVSSKHALERLIGHEKPVIGQQNPRHWSQSVRSSNNMDLNDNRPTSPLPPRPPRSPVKEDEWIPRMPLLQLGPAHPEFEEIFTPRYKRAIKHAYSFDTLRDVNGNPTPRSRRISSQSTMSYSRPPNQPSWPLLDRTNESTTTTSKKKLDTIESNTKYRSGITNQNRELRTRHSLPVMRSFLDLPKPKSILKRQGSKDEKWEKDIDFCYDNEVDSNFNYRWEPKSRVINGKQTAKRIFTVSDSVGPRRRLSYTTQTGVNPVTKDSKAQLDASHKQSVLEMATKDRPIPRLEDLGTMPPELKDSEISLSPIGIPKDNRLSTPEFTKQLNTEDVNLQRASNSTTDSNSSSWYSTGDEKHHSTTSTGTALTQPSLCSVSLNTMLSSPVKESVAKAEPKSAAMTSTNENSSPLLLPIQGVKEGRLAGLSTEQGTPPDVLAERRLSSAILEEDGALPAIFPEYEAYLATIMEEETSEARPDEHKVAVTPSVPKQEQSEPLSLPNMTETKSKAIATAKEPTTAISQVEVGFNKGFELPNTSIPSRKPLPLHTHTLQPTSAANGKHETDTNVPQFHSEDSSTQPPTVDQSRAAPTSDKAVVEEPSLETTPKQNTVSLAAPTINNANSNERMSETKLDSIADSFGNNDPRLNSGALHSQEMMHQNTMRGNFMPNIGSSDQSSNFMPGNKMPASVPLNTMEPPNVYTGMSGNMMYGDIYSDMTYENMMYESMMYRQMMYRDMMLRDTVSGNMHQGAALGNMHIGPMMPANMPMRGMHPNMMMNMNVPKPMMPGSGVPGPHIPGYKGYGPEWSKSPLAGNGHNANNAFGSTVTQNNMQGNIQRNNSQASTDPEAQGRLNGNNMIPKNGRANYPQSYYASQGHNAFNDLNQLNQRQHLNGFSQHTNGHLGGNMPLNGMPRNVMFGMNNMNNNHMAAMSNYMGANMSSRSATPTGMMYSHHAMSESDMSELSFSGGMTDTASLRSWPSNMSLRSNSVRNSYSMYL